MGTWEESERSRRKEERAARLRAIKRARAEVQRVWRKRVEIAEAALRGIMPSTDRDAAAIDRALAVLREGVRRG